MSDKNKFAGMEDLIDLIDFDSNSQNERKTDAFKEHEVLQFLELEETRLKKLDTFFSIKCNNIARNPQSNHIYEELCAKVDNKRDELIKRLIRLDSPLNIELKQMWQSMFDVS